MLIAEDDAISRRVLHATLVKWGYEPVVAQNGEQAWALLQTKDAPKLAILDWMMPGLDGADVCRRIRQAAEKEYTYIILLTAKGRREDIIEGMNAGADDYVTKPFDPGELRVRVRAAERVLALQSELIGAREALREQATHDSLTGLWNRPAVIDALRRELERAARDGTSVGVILADLDHFKEVNDTFGHGAGDAVLREVAARMASALRSYDTVGRYGGEEFLIVLPGCDAHTTGRQAERLRERLASEPAHAGAVPIPMTMSLGATASGPGGGTNPDCLIQAADAAMYQAKREGRNRVVVHHGEEGATAAATRGGGNPASR